MKSLNSQDLINLYSNIIDIIHDFYINMNLLNKKQIYTYFQNVKGWFRYYHHKMELSNEAIDHKIYYTDKEFNDLCDNKFEEIRKDIDSVIYFRYKHNFFPQETEKIELLENVKVNDNNKKEINNISEFISINNNDNNIINSKNDNNNEITENDINQDNISNLFFNLENKKTIFMIKLKNNYQKVDLVEKIKDNKYKFEESFYVYHREGQLNRNWYFYIKTKYAISFPFPKYKEFEYNNLEITRKEKRDHIISFGNKVDII